MLSPPEALIPQTIGSFNRTIPLGFVAATESRVVVHLQSIGQAQDTPRLQRMALNTLQTLVGADRLLQRTCPQIECVKGKDLTTTREELRRPIHRIQHIIGRGARLWEIDFPCRVRRFDQARFVQHALDGRASRDSAQQSCLPQFGLNRARTNQSDFASLQSAARLNHQTSSSPVVTMRNHVRAAGLAPKPLPAYLVKVLFPFRQPGAASSETF